MRPVTGDAVDCTVAVAVLLQLTFKVQCSPQDLPICSLQLSCCTHNTLLVPWGALKLCSAVEWDVPGKL